MDPCTTSRPARRKAGRQAPAGAGRRTGGREHAQARTARAQAACGAMMLPASAGAVGTGVAGSSKDRRSTWRPVPQLPEPAPRKIGFVLIGSPLISCRMTLGQMFEDNQTSNSDARFLVGKPTEQHLRAGARPSSVSAESGYDSSMCCTYGRLLRMKCAVSKVDASNPPRLNMLHYLRNTIISAYISA